jgi:hypothetical protein
MFVLGLHNLHELQWKQKNRSLLLFSLLAWLCRTEWGKTTSRGNSLDLDRGTSSLECGLWWYLFTSPGEFILKHATADSFLGYSVSPHFNVPGYPVFPFIAKQHNHPKDPGSKHDWNVGQLQGDCMAPYTTLAAVPRFHTIFSLRL